MTEQELQAKIASLVSERDNFTANANRMIGQFNGEIEVYREWLQSLPLPVHPHIITPLAERILADGINGNSE